eukprot:4409929-Amphidinium_carterae.1
MILFTILGATVWYAGNQVTKLEALSHLHCVCWAAKPRATTVANTPNNPKTSPNELGVVGVN